MTNKQFFTLCGILCLCTASISHAWYVSILGLIYFITAICTND